MRAADSRRADREARRLLESGSRLLRARRLDLAVEKLQRAADLLPNDLTVRVNLGTAYYLNGRPHRAADQFREAARLAPDNPTVLLNLAAARNAMGDADGAIESLERALQISPQHPDLHYNLAIAYLARGDRQRGIEELGLELQANPNSQTALRLLHRLSGDPEAQPPPAAPTLSEHGRRPPRAQPGWRVWVFSLAVAVGALIVALWLRRG
jgi:Flp pilus assembly protein TadD